MSSNILRLIWEVIRFLCPPCFNSSVYLPPGPQDFSGYYLSKHGGRKLAWHSTASNCLVRAHFPSGVKELQASLHQVRIGACRGLRGSRAC